MRGVRGVLFRSTLLSRVTLPKISLEHLISLRDSNQAGRTLKPDSTHFHSLPDNSTHNNPSYVNEFSVTTLHLSRS